MFARALPFTAFLLVALLSSACSSDDEIDSDAAARQAYLGLDEAVGKALALGMDGFNAATSANMPPQMTTGSAAGTMTISGQVDMGSSANKGMRLRLDLVDYRDTRPDGEPQIAYDTNADAQPALDLSLRGIPDGTLTGTLLGDFHMSGDLTGTVTLNLTFDGAIETDPMDATRVRRVAGTTHVTGTATSGYGTFAVDVTI